MPAGDGLKRVRTVWADSDETIEIVWRRRLGGVDQELHERHTAPPVASWEARLKEPDDRADSALDT